MFPLRKEVNNTGINRKQKTLQKHDMLNESVLIYINFKILQSDEINNKFQTMIKSSALRSQV